MAGTSFKSYAKRFRKNFNENAGKWARDNLGLNLCISLGVFLLSYVLGSRPDWNLLKATAFLYGVAILVYAAIHFVLTPLRLDRERANEIQMQTRQINEQQAELEELKSSPEATINARDLHFLPFTTHDHRINTVSHFHIFVFVSITLHRPVASMASRL